MELSEFKIKVEEYLSTLPEGRRRRWPSEIRKAAIGLMSSGLSVKAIEAGSGISSKTLASWKPESDTVLRALVFESSR